MLYKKLQFIVETNKNYKFVFDKMQGQSHAILIIFNHNFSIYCYYIFFFKINKIKMYIQIDAISLREVFRMKDPKNRLSG